MTMSAQTSKTPSGFAAPKTPPRLLREFRPVKLTLSEAADGKGGMRVRGEFARCGIATENKRVYPGMLWEREIGRLNSAMENRRLFGELDHPTDGRTMLKRVSHIITQMTVTDDGIVIGEAEVLDTPEGQAMQALLKAGCQVGVSSRGYGSTRPNEKGEEVVQEDYRLVTFDFVAEPADNSAYPSIVYEDKNMAATNEAQLEAIRQDERAKAEVELRTEFGTKLVEAVGKLRTELQAKVKAELLADPTVAASKSTLEQVAALLKGHLIPEGSEAFAKEKATEIKSLSLQLAESQLRVKELEAENTKLTDVAREVGYKFFLEHELSGDPDAKAIRRAVGDVTQFKTSKDLQKRVEGLREDFAARRVETKKLEEAKLEAEARSAKARQQDIDRSVQVENKVQESMNELQEALGQSLEANKMLMLRVYAEGKIRNHPQAARLSQMLETANLTSKDAVDRFLASQKMPAKGVEDLDQIRARVKNRVGGGFSHQPADEERQTERGKRITSGLNEAAGNGGGGDITGTGQSLDEFRTLSGLGQ